MLRVLTVADILNIDRYDTPFAVLSSDSNNFLSFGIRVRTHSLWNHFMWMIRPRYFASQGFIFSEVPVQKFFGYSKQLIFWYNPQWTEQEKVAIENCIMTYLKKPAFTTRYDWIAIIGQLLGMAWLQNPATRICSEYGSALRESGVDLEYTLKTPSPAAVNEWFENNPKYKSFGRYIGDT